MRGLGPTTLVGLDVGTCCVKAVELKREGDELEVAHLGLEPVVTAGEGEASEGDAARFAEAIGRLFSASNNKHTAVVASVSGNAVIVKKITVPAASGQELAESIQQEAAHHLPFDLGEVNLDYQILSEAGDGQPLDVLLVAVRKEKVASAAEPITQAGKQLDIMDVDTLALGNCYEFNYQPPPGEVTALVNLGASMMNLNIVKGGMPLFPRDVNVGGHLYSDELCRELGVSVADAEALKMGSAVGAITAQQVAPILRQVTEIILLEIHKTLDFYRAGDGAEPIERIYLAGGSARVPGLVEVLRQEFSMPVELLDPFLRLSVPPELAEIAASHGSQMAVAVGLALRSFEQP